MRNRAKCKLCSSVIESFHRFDLVSCKCGEISISGGLDFLECFAKDFSNFLRIDEEGKEVKVKLIDKPKVIEEVPVDQEEQPQLSKEDKIKMVDAMLKYYDDLPKHALLSPPTQYDIKAVFLMIKQVLM